MASFLIWNLEGGWDNPENHFKRAIQLSPNSAETHEAYAEYVDDLGLFSGRSGGASTCAVSGRRERLLELVAIAVPNRTNRAEAEVSIDNITQWG